MLLDPGDGRTIKVGAKSYPVVLPKLGDARLHVAAIILSIHAIGLLALDFRVTVPQILAAILSCALLETIAQFWRQRAVVWPASAMLTGSGVALILRDVGTESGDYWSFHQWWLFALVATGSLATKYVIRWKGTHVFNPSNVGLVVAFLVLGSSRIEPLDFWWAPFRGWMIFAYGLILVGGVVITRRAGLLDMAAAFWVTLGACLGVLALVGHCFSAPWSITPVCDGRFWWTVMMSPETLVFVLFMITDPRTTPFSAKARVGFGAAVGVISAVLIAPQQTEFGAKVGLLGGLVIVCGLRSLALGVGERLWVRPWTWVSRPTIRWVGLVVALVVALSTVAAAGVGARDPAPVRLSSEGMRADEIVANVDPARVPEVTVGEFVDDWLGSDVNPTLLATELLRLLDVENLALARRDVEILEAANHGVRLRELRERVEAAGESPIAGEVYDFDSMHLQVMPAVGQGDLILGVVASGTQTHAVYAADETTQLGRSEPFTLVFAMRPGSMDRWFLVAVTEDPG